MNLIHAQEARRGADRLVGYQVSPMLSRQTGIAGLSAGRVQTVAVRFVVDRQREIRDFTVTKHFGAEAAVEDGKWTAQWDTTPFLKTDEKYIREPALAEQAARCREFRVVEAATKPARQAHPPPFTTATLLQAASVSLGFKPDQTAQLAQKLFEQGLITYHRTDSQNFSVEALSDIREFCPSEHLRRPNGKEFYGCDRYREGCTFSVNVSVAQKKLTDKQIETLSIKGKTGLIRGFINKQGKPFDAILFCSEATGWRTKFEFENKSPEPKRYF